MGKSGGTMKGTRETAMTTMKRARRKKRRGRETDPRYNIMFMSKETEVGVSEVNAAGYDKLLECRGERRVSSHRVEGIMNRLQVYYPSPGYEGADRDVCIPKLLLGSRERGKIGTVEKKRGPKKLRAGCAPTKENIKYDNNNDDDNNKAMDDADLYSKDPHRTARDLMW